MVDEGRMQISKENDEMQCTINVQHYVFMPDELSRSMQIREEKMCK